MSNPAVIVKPDNAKQADPLGPRIPIAMLQSGTARQWPGGDVSHVLESTPKAHVSQKRRVISFLPRIGMYEVQLFKADEVVADETHLVPKEWASGTVAPG